MYLPVDLYNLVKKRRLPASELLQDAVRAEVRRPRVKYAAAPPANTGVNGLRNGRGLARVWR